MTHPDREKNYFLNRIIFDEQGNYRFIQWLIIIKFCFFRIAFCLALVFITNPMWQLNVLVAIFGFVSSFYPRTSCTLSSCENSSTTSA